MNIAASDGRRPGPLPPVLGARVKTGSCERNGQCPRFVFPAISQV